MSAAAFAGSWTPASSMTIWSVPCLRTSGEETPSLSMRFWMICCAVTIPAESTFTALRRDRLQDDLEAALEVEAERGLPVDGRSGQSEHDHADDRGAGSRP